MAVSVSATMTQVNEDGSESPVDGELWVSASVTGDIPAMIGKALGPHPGGPVLAGQRADGQGAAGQGASAPSPG